MNVDVYKYSAKSFIRIVRIRALTDNKLASEEGMEKLY